MISSIAQAVSSAVSDAPSIERRQQGRPASVRRGVTGSADDGDAAARGAGSARRRPSAASTGSSGMWITASASDQLASQPSCGRAISTTIGGQSSISYLNCRASPMPPVGWASPSRITRSRPPSSSCSTTSAFVAHSTQSMRPMSGAGRRPTAVRTCGPHARRIAVDEDGRALRHCAVMTRSYRRPRRLAIRAPTSRIDTITAHPYPGAIPAYRQDIMQGDIDCRGTELRVQQGALADATEHRQRRHDRLALQRADVLRRAVRHVLHGARRAPGRLADDAARGRAGHAGEQIKLSLGYATPFTIILVASSFTCQWGVFAAEKGDVFKLRRWFTLTFFMGLIFVLGQANEYRIQVADGNTISRTGYGSVFFLTTGFHGLHVIGGLIAFILFLSRTTLGKFTPAQATAAIVVSYYWHFVDVVWIGLFAIDLHHPMSRPIRHLKGRS